MSHYYLFYKKTQEKFEKLSRLQLTEKLRSLGDHQECLYWSPGMQNWKVVAQAPEVLEWLSFTWDEKQIVPPLPPSFIEIKSFAGQVVDFSQPLKDKYLSSEDFKIVPSSSQPDFDNTMNTNIDLKNISDEVTNTSAPLEESKLEQTQSQISVLSDFTMTKEVPASVFEEAMKEASHFEDLTKTQVPLATPQEDYDAKKHSRRYPRIKGKLRTIITNKSKAFMTFTKDISLGGIQIENAIPLDILNSEIEVYISDPSGKKSILFRCHPVGDRNQPNRFSFAKADEKNLQKLGQWLDDLSKSPRS
jgi:PilZ domain